MLVGLRADNNNLGYKVVKLKDAGILLPAFLQMKFSRLRTPPKASNNTSLKPIPHVADCHFAPKPIIRSQQRKYG
jgi:hypothetical protein